MAFAVWTTVTRNSLKKGELLTNQKPWLIMMKQYFAENLRKLRHNADLTQDKLADFLSVDRSAMSAELCKMRDEGLLTFKKNQFTLF